MSNFEKIVASPETLGRFLAALPIATGPWDELFHRQFCDSCGTKNCGTPGCPHQAERNNPTWWLRLDEKIKAAPTTEPQERQGDIHRAEKLFEEIKTKIMERDCTPEEAIEVLGSVRIMLINMVKQAKESLHP